MFCPRCGDEIPDDSLFCESCGKTVKSKKQGPAPVGPPASLRAPPTGKTASPQAREPVTPEKKQTPPVQSSSRTPVRMEGFPERAAVGAKSPKRVKAEKEKPVKEGKPEKPAKKGKKILVATVVLVVIAGMTFCGIYFFIVGKSVSDEDDIGYVRSLNTEDFVTDEHTGLKYVSDEILVVLKEEVGKEDLGVIISDIDGEVVGHINDTGFYQLLLKKKCSLEELFNISTNFENIADVESASPNFVYTNQIISPDDPEYSDSNLQPYNLSTGQETTDDSDSFPEYFPDGDSSSDTWDEENPSGRNWGIEAIKAPSAWEHNGKIGTFNIGIIEVDDFYNHEDINVPEEHIYQKENDQQAGDANHATAVTGVIGAETNNSYGVSGVVWRKNRELWVYEAVDDAEVLLGIKRLLADGVKVINLSFGNEHKGLWGTYFGFTDEDNPRVKEKLEGELSESRGLWTRELLQIIESEKEQGRGDFLIVQAAGNNQFNAEYNGACCSIGIDQQELRNRILIVGAMELARDASGGEALEYEIWAKPGTGGILSVGDAGSNYGPVVDILAPGEFIFTTCSGYTSGGEPTGEDTPRSTYGFGEGTSGAAPFVSGVAGLVWAANPDLKPEEVKGALIESSDSTITDNRKNLDPRYLGRGYPLLNAEAAVKKALENEPKAEYGIVFVRDGNVLEAGEDSPIYSGGDIESIDGVSPDGKLIAVHKMGDDIGWVMNNDGTSLGRLFNESEVPGHGAGGGNYTGVVRWAGDSLYVSTGGGSSGGWIYQADADGSNLREYAFRKTHWGFDISQNNKLACIEKDYARANIEKYVPWCMVVWLSNLDGGDAVEIDDMGSEWSSTIAVSPDGNNVIYSNSSTIWNYDVNSGPPVEISLGHGTCLLYDFSPDGSQFTYTDGDSMFIGHLDGSDPEEIGKGKTPYWIQI